MNWIENYLRAGDPEVSEQQLALLANSENSRIRMRVAENPRATRRILEKLAVDTDPDVRLAVATNRSSPRYLIEQLALDKDATIRHGIAEDPLTPLTLLQQLCHDGNPYVSCRAKKTLTGLGNVDFNVIDIANNSERGTDWAPTIRYA
ncbi:MAG TPA: HEAT repeat domain-containing protein [Candidatus Obscuribacterales bacterium]